MPALIGAPVAWLGGSPVLVFNLVLLAGFLLTALSGYALVRAWTGDGVAALLAGTTLAFNSHTLSRLAHVQGVHLYGLALALLAADRLVTRPRARHALALAGWMSLLVCTSGYLAVFGALSVAIAVGVRLPEWVPRKRAVLASLLLAIAVSAVVILPVARPYRRVAREQGMTRMLGEVTEFSLRPVAYVAAPGRAHRVAWSESLFATPVDTFFPGLVVTVLALVGVARVRERTDARGPMVGRVAMLVAVAATGFLLSLGTHTPVYGWLYSVVPPFRGLRAVARFGMLFLLGLSLLAGFGLARLRSRAGYSRRSSVVACALVLLANLESLRAPLRFRPFEGIPAIYDRLATDWRPVVLVEVPFYPPETIFGNAEYVLNSTRHWRQVMNGYSGYMPPSYAQYAEQFRDFPAQDAVAAMRRAGVTHVMVHPRRLQGAADEVVRRFEARVDVERLAVDPTGLRLYRFR